MYLNSQMESECCGCSACEQICPHGCIQMKRNDEGFLYPVVDRAGCVQCGLCEKVCPIANYQRQEQKDICYYGWHKDEQTRRSSTSGAAFMAIAQVCRNHGYEHFYGAAYDPKLQVRHRDVRGFQEPELLQGTKYTQSDMADIYAQVKQNLLKGEKVLFSGTPCQVDGLKHYLGKIGEQNLLLVALVCHGVSSPAAYAAYLREVGRDHGSDVAKIRFRDKREENGKLSHRFTTLVLQDGRELASTEDLYTMAFGIGVMDRESCYRCLYTSPSGAGDITIGDFWGLEKTVPEISGEISKGISLMIPHTDKGEKLMADLAEYMVLQRVPLAAAINEGQQQLQKPLERPRLRDSFLKHLLLEKKTFRQEAKRAIFAWKMAERKKRLVKMAGRVFAKNKV